MTPSESNNERQQLERAIAAQESLRGTVDDALIDATIATLKEKLAALDSSPDQQRKLATILFMDIADHTALTRGMDPEDQMALIDPLIARLAEKVTEFGGHVARYQGDGFKAVFGLPIAQENDPEQAIRAGLAIQEEARAIAAELENEHGIFNFKVRVGITTGLVFAGGDTEGEDTIKGSPVNLAARLESAAEPGTVLIAYDTYKHVRGIFSLEELEPMQVKGFPDPVQVFRVKGAKPRAFYRGMRLVEGVETRMIGREAELETLKDAYYTVVEDGELQIVTIVGEAGLGKSRLLYEFENWVDLQLADVRLYRGRAHLESQRLPYDLLRSIFAFRFNIQDDDSLEIVKEKWLAGFQEPFVEVPDVDTNLEMQAHILGQLLGYDFSNSPHVKPLLGEPQQLRDRSMVYLAGYFKAVAKIMPVLVLLEDLHWADDSSLETLSRLGLELRDTPVLIVSAARPRLYERRPYWFEGREFHRRVDLKPLSKRFNRQLVNEVLQRIPDIPKDLSSLIVNNAEGNPFYVEELVKVLVEAGVILTRELHWMVDEEQLEQTDVPSTLTGVLQARLERLPKAEHTLIQQASVVGRVFWDQAVWYLNHQGEGTLEEQDIQAGLVDLRGREMIYRRELSAFLDAKEYVFKHAVLREVTYESVLKKLRHAYHSLAAEWLMEQRSGRSGEVVGLIADHLELAGEREEALRYLRRAGEEAAKKYANQEAVDYFSRALALAPESDLETRFDLLLAREKVLDLQAKREAQRQDLEALEILSEKLESVEKQMEVGIRKSRFFWFLNDYPYAVNAAEQVVAKAENAANLQYIAEGHLRWGRALIWMDQFEIALQHLELALEGFKATGDQREISNTLRSLGMAAGGLFEYEDIKEIYEQALSIAQKIGDRSYESAAANNLGSFYMEIGDYSSTQKQFSQSLKIAQEIGNLSKQSVAFGNLGRLAITLQDFESARNYRERSLELAQASDDRGTEGLAMFGLGEAYDGLDLEDAAIQAYLKAIKIFEDIGADWGIVETKSRLARITLARNEVKRSIDFVDHVLNYLKASKVIGHWRGPTEIYLICVHVLQAANDPRADGVLETAYNELKDRAEKIKDGDLRHSLLENVPWNRELVKLWEEQQEHDNISE